MPYRKVAAQRRKRASLLLLVADFTSICIAVTLSAIGAHDLEAVTSLPFVGRGSVVVSVFISIAWLVSLTVADSRDPRLLFSGTAYYERTLRGTFLAFALLAIFGFAFDVRAVRPYILVGFPLGLLVIVISRRIVRHWALARVKESSDHWLLERVLLVRAAGDDLSDEIITEVPYMRRASSCTSSDVDEIVANAISAEATVVLLCISSDLNPAQASRLAWRLEDEQISICIEPTAGGLVRPGRSSVIPHPLVTLLSVRTIHLTTHERVLKRGLDLAVGSLLFIVLTPVLLTGATLVLIDGGRPIFFKQLRVGELGKTFSIRKLRTMRPGADEHHPIHFAEGLTFTKDPNDPRITRVGRLLRRWSIDEIPQLVNVLKGDMSLVGPRPRLLSEMTESPVATRRLHARPGLTGVWQTSGRASIPFDQADLLDVEYVDNWSLLGDLVIIIRTIRSVLQRDGAY